MDCKLLYLEKNRLTVSRQKATANSVPAAAVIRGSQALAEIIGRKEPVGGLKSRLLNQTAQLSSSNRNSQT